jgi:O-antigen/teichoic acid export membrane protein
MIQPETASSVADGRRMLTAVSVNVVSSALAAIAGLFATGYIARSVSIAEFGQIVLLLTLVTAFAIFEGQRPVVIHRVAANIGTPGALFRAAGRMNAAMTAVTLTCVATGYALGATGSLGAYAMAALGLTVAAFFVAMQFWTFLDAEQDTVFTGLSRSISWIVLYTAFSAIAWLGLNLVAYTFALLITHAMLAAVLFARFRRLKLNRKYAYAGGGAGPGLLKPAFNNILFNVCAVTINVADRAIVSQMMGVRAAGLYSGPSELALRSVGLVRAGVQVILPWAARLSPAHQQRYWLLAVTGIVVLTSTGGAVLLLWREDFAALFLGEPFRQTGDLLGIFGMGIVTTTLGYACIVQLNSRGDFSTQRKLYMFGAAILLVGAVWGGNQRSLLMVASAFLVARLVDVVLLLLLLRACSLGARLWFLLVSLSCVAGLVTAWNGAALVTFVLLAIAYGLGYSFWHRSRHVAP